MRTFNNLLNVLFNYFDICLHSYLKTFPMLFILFSFWDICELLSYFPWFIVIKLPASSSISYCSSIYYAEQYETLQNNGDLLTTNQRK